MSNFIVNSCVYTMPQSIPDLPDESVIKTFENYLDNLNILIDKIYPESLPTQLKENTMITHFYFLQEDIIFLLDNDLFLTNENIKKLKNFIGDRYKPLVTDLRTNLLSTLEQLRFGPRNKNSKRLDPEPRYLNTVEKYLGIKYIEASENNPSAQDELTETNKISSPGIINKSIFILAFLNKFVLKQNDITKIMTDNINIYNLNLKFSIKNIKHNFNNIAVSNCNIINQNLKEYEPLNFDSIEKVLDICNTKFGETLEFLESNVSNSINIYKNILKKMKKKYITNMDYEYLDTINAIEKNYPSLIYNCMEGLDKLVKYYNSCDKPRPELPISNIFKCRTIGNESICNKCLGYLRLCGYDCSPESEDDLKDSKVIEERTFDGQLYTIHLKPYTFSIKSKYEEASIRIYFTWDSEKIKIGYIGKHLWLPS